MGFGLERASERESVCKTERERARERERGVKERERGRERESKRVREEERVRVREREVLRFKMLNLIDTPGHVCLIHKVAPSLSLLFWCV